MELCEKITESKKGVEPESRVLLYCFLNSKLQLWMVMKRVRKKIVFLTLFEGEEAINEATACYNERLAETESERIQFEKQECGLFFKYVADHVLYHSLIKLSANAGDNPDTKSARRLITQIERSGTICDSHRRWAQNISFKTPGKVRDNGSCITWRANNPGLCNWDRAPDRGPSLRESS
jgi:hypothetical protein